MNNKNIVTLSTFGLLFMLLSCMNMARAATFYSCRFLNQSQLQYMAWFMKDARDNAKIKNVSAARPFTYDENLQKKLSLKSPNIALSANNICKHFVFSPLTVADNEGENSNKAVENLVMIRSFLPEFGKKMQIEGSKLAYLRVQEVGSTDQRPNYAWCEKAEVILDANFSVNSAVQNEIRLVERNWSQVTRVKDDSCAMM